MGTGEGVVGARRYQQVGNFSLNIGRGLGILAGNLGTRLEQHGGQLQSR